MKVSALQAKHPFLCYLGVLLMLLMVLWIFKSTPFEDSAALIASLSTLIVSFSMLIGAFMLVSFYANANPFFLFLGWGFVGYGLLVVVNFAWHSFGLDDQPSAVMAYLSQLIHQLAALCLPIFLLISSYDWRKRALNRITFKPTKPLLTPLKAIFWTSLIISISIFSETYLHFLFLRNLLPYLPLIFFTLAFTKYQIHSTSLIENFHPWLSYAILGNIFQQITALQNTSQAYGYILQCLSLLMVIAGILMRNYAIFKLGEKRSEDLLCSKMAYSEYAKELEKIAEERSEKLLLSQQKLVIADKLASLGQLTAGIAHEIKNPLNFVINFSILSSKGLSTIEALIKNQENLLEPETYNEIKVGLATLQFNTRKIQEHGRRADSIIRTMLLHAGSNKVAPPKQTDINTLLEEGFNLAYHGMRATHSMFTIHFVPVLDGSIEGIEIVPQDIMRVFLNLINNAFYSTHCKFLRLGSIIEPQLSITTKNLGEAIAITFRDNGEGIEEGIINKLFTPFFTTKPAGEGTGLGLSLSYDIIVKKYAGKISVNSVYGKYAEFILILPKKHKPPLPAKKMPEDLVQRHKLP